MFSGKITFEDRINLIKELIKLSSSCYGKVFGEFVRNAIVPKDNTAQFDYVNIWFTSKDVADIFVFRAKVNFNFLQLDEKMYSYFVDGHQIAFVKIFISKTLPVDDFDINCLTYYYENNNFFLDREILTIKLDLLINSIKNKKMLLFYNYGKNLNDSKIKKISTFLEKGWTVRYNGNIVGQEWITANC